MVRGRPRLRKTAGMRASPPAKRDWYAGVPACEKKRPQKILRTFFFEGGMGLDGIN